MGAGTRRHRTPLAVLIDALRRLPWLLVRVGRTGGGRAGGVLRVWVWWERLTTRWGHLQRARPGGVVLIARGRRRGRAVTLADGTVVRPGDPIVELHLDSRAMVRHGAHPQAHPLRAARLMRADLAALAGRVHDGDLRDARALHGVTIMAPASRRLGFEVRPLPRTAGWSLVRYFMLGLLAIYHPDGWDRTDHLRATAWPGEIWMSRRALLARYASAVPPPP